MTKDELARLSGFILLGTYHDLVKTLQKALGGTPFPRYQGRKWDPHYAYAIIVRPSILEMQVDREHRRMLDDSGPVSTKLGRSLPTLAEVWTQLGPSSPELGPNSATLAKLSP